MQDVYKTLSSPSEEVLYKEKSSKFYGYAFPVKTEDDIRSALDSVKKKHPAARHWCYAWQTGTETVRYRANDDGEPSHTAGTPIYGQIQSFGLTNVLVVVARYFGGIKLGAGGLVTAYRTTAQMALQASGIVERTIETLFVLRFEYKDLNRVMRVIREKQLALLSQKMEGDCLLEISCRKKDEKNISEILNAMHGIEVRIKK